jgi:hypothetical protein
VFRVFHSARFLPVLPLTPCWMLLSENRQSVSTWKVALFGAQYLTGGHRDRNAATLIPQPYQTSPKVWSGRALCNVLFEACAAFTRVTACTLAKSPKVTLYTRGFSRFVTSITAPIASGCSKIAEWDSHPLENAAFCTAHTQPGRLVSYISGG